MAQRQGLVQELKQEQRLLPLLQLQLVPYLSMNSQEISQEVQKELYDNPALEPASRDDAAEQDSAPAGQQQTEEQAAASDNGDDADDTPYYMRRARNQGPDDDSYRPEAADEVSLSDYLMDQVRSTSMSEGEQLIAQYIIGNLDPNGYLRSSAMQIADDITFKGGMEVEESDVEKVLDKVKQLDPPGIAAANLQECLLLQLQRREKTPVVSLAINLVKNHFGDLEKLHYDKMRTALGVDDDGLKQVINEIKSLNPKPGSGYSSGSSEISSQQVTPDFIVEVDDDRLTLTSPNRNIALQISESYSLLAAKDKKDKSLSASEKGEITYARNYVNRANNFMTLMKMRRETLFNTMKAILNYQRAYFLSGDEKDLRPMTLKDIAAVTGYDLSVISRATTNKYVEMPNGDVKELKFFFSEGIRHEDGSEVSSKEVLKALSQIVAGENKRRPLSDDALCDKLNEQGYKLARRTVAKYRERLGIPKARLRKEI